MVPYRYAINLVIVDLEAGGDRVEDPLEEPPTPPIEEASKLQLET